MRHKFIWLLSVCLLVCSFRSFSQTAKFSADIHGGCAPIVNVVFTNQSSGFSAGAKYELNFGDAAGNIPFAGSNTSLTHTYNNEQTYIATLTVTDGATVLTDTEKIVVYKKPTVAFAPSITKACVNTNVTFTSTSTAGDGTIASYQWDFGDGVVQSTTDPIIQHKYTSAKNPNIGVSLTVTNSYGCTNFLSNTNTLTVLAAPKVSFTANPTFVCNTTDPITFTNTTTGGTPPTTYIWDFNDGTNSTAVNPVHIFGEKNTYNVRLLATSADGCSDTSKLTAITVASSKSDITLPTLLCLNANLIFTDNSAPQTNNPVWLLDGAVVVSDVHQFNYTFTDTKQHKLQLANNYGACSDTATKLIQAQTAPVPSPFTVSIAGSCTVPVMATFTDVGAGSTKWEWDFNNVNPAVFNPTKFTKTTDYTYTTENTYYVKLRVTDGSGCTGEVRQPVVIKKNYTTVSSSEGANGCKTLSTTFSATSTNPIAEYNWTFTDDNSTSVLAKPSHLFVNIGTYLAKLKIKTTGGCSDSASLSIHIGNAPSFDFELLSPADTLVCGNKAVTFKVTGDTDKIVGQYYWKFGEVDAYSLLYNPPYTHQYSTDSLFDVSLSIDNHGCKDTVTKKAVLRVLPPFPKISAIVTNCDDRLKIVFKETTKRARTYSWDFGDKTPVYTYDSLNIQSEIPHSFPKTGAYKVILTATNGTCVAKDSVYGRVLQKQNPLLTATLSELCASDSLATTVSNMELNPFGSIFKYDIKAIQYQNNTPFTGSYSISSGTYAVPFFPTITGLTSGNQNIRIITNSYSFNCPDTTNYIPVQITGPVAGFAVSNISFCLADKIFFDDTSKQGGTAPITSWHWIFGDNFEQTLASDGDIFYKYGNTGDFKVKLVVTDAKNCQDTAFFSGSALTIKGPQARFSVETNPILPNTPEVFTNLTDSGSASRVNNSYQWDFGDNAYSTSNADKVSHSYAKYAFDTVKLVATSSVTGCTDSVTNVVQVKNTKIKFTYSLANPNQVCAPALYNFENTSINFDLPSWDFGNGKTANDINNPSTTYDKPGTYKVTVFGYFPDNTYDSAVSYISVVGPTATIEADVIPGCGSKRVIFTAHTLSTTSLSWDFQDGTSSIDSVVTHYYSTPNIYAPVLTVKNGPSCVFSYPITIPIAIDSIHVDINLDSIKQCHQLLVNFKPAVFSVAKVNNQRVDYSWDFGDGVSTSPDDTTSFTYTKPGKYTVKFKATSLYGCSDSATTEVEYVDPPHAGIKANVTEFCENTPQTFTAVKTNSNDVLTYEWTFENGIVTDQNPPPQTFTAAWNDSSVILITKYDNCTDTVYQPLIIHSQPKVMFLVSDSVVCSGTAITFTGTPSTNNPQDHFTYKWDFGNSASSTDSLTTYTYPKAGVYSPVLHVDNAGQCSGDFKPVVKILVDSLNISINKDSVIQCHQLLVNFKPAVFGIAKDNGGEVKYTWKFGEGSTSQKDTTSFTYTKPNIYPVTFTASTTKGCTATATTEVTYTDPFPVSIQAAQPEFCENTPQTFTAVKTNSNDVLTYEWTFENGTSTLQTPPPQTFTAAWKDSIRLTVDRNGCKDVVYYKPKVHGIPDIAIGLSDAVSCLGKAVVFTAKNITTLPEPVTYAWDFGSGNTSDQQTTSYLFTAAAKYPVSLTATSAFGCSKEVKDTVLVNPTPVASAQGTQDVCIGSAASFQGSSNVASVQYDWRFSDGTKSAEQNPVKTFSAATARTYYLIVTTGICSDTTTSQTIMIHDLPLADITTPSATPRACRGDSVQLVAHNGQTYQWLNASSITNASVADPYVFPATDTRYTVQLTDSYGCKNTDSILVTITQPQTLTVTSPVSVCIGDKASLTASGTDSYNWLDGADLTDATIASPSTKDSATSKTYTVVGSDSYGCFNSNGTVEVIVRNKPVVADIPNQIIPAGTDVKLTASADDNNVTWAWTPPLYLTCANCASPVSKLKQTVTYTVQATNSYGCKGYDTVLLQVICKASLVNVPQIFTPNNDGLNDKFHIIAQGIKNIKHIVIYSRNGNKVFERNNVSPLSNDASWDGMSDHQYMPSDTYIYLIQAECDVDNVVFNLQGTITLIR